MKRSFSVLEHIRLDSYTEDVRLHDRGRLTYFGVFGDQGKAGWPAPKRGKRLAEKPRL